MRRKGTIVTIAPALEVAAKEKKPVEAAKARSNSSRWSRNSFRSITPRPRRSRRCSSRSRRCQHDQSGTSVFGATATGSTTAAQPATASNTLLSPRGQVTVDARNSILVQDTPAKIREVRKLIAQLDQPIRRVMIESRLVEAPTISAARWVRAWAIKPRLSKNHLREC